MGDMDQCDVHSDTPLQPFRPSLPQSPSSDEVLDAETTPSQSLSRKSKILRTVALYIGFVLLVSSGREIVIAM